MTVSGKTILITGASRGIGAAAARHLASKGANVVLSARSTSDIERISDEIGTNARAIGGDVGDYGAAKAMVDCAADAFGSIDVVVNNAGLIDPIHRLTDCDPDDWGRIIDVNVKGVFNTMHAAIPRMVDQGVGTIINISSGAAYNVLEGWSHYCASKAAVLQLTRSGDKEYGDKGITCVGLSPGTIATDMQVKIKASGLNPVSEMDFSDHRPPIAVARVIEHLCGPAAQNYRGQDFMLKSEEGLKVVNGS
ncbi:MAG: SDR family oxidoreductase [Planktomarina sp.]